MRRPRKSEMVAAAKARRKQKLTAEGTNGKPYTRQTPAWITWRDESKAYELLPDRAAIVREIFERTDKGEGINRIAKDLNARGVELGAGTGRGDRHEGRTTGATATCERY